MISVTAVAPRPLWHDIYYMYHICIYVTHQMQNMHGGSHAVHFDVTSTTMLTGTNRKAQQSCGSGTVRE